MKPSLAKKEQIQNIKILIYKHFLGIYLITGTFKSKDVSKQYSGTQI